ncbi:MAG: membrane protein insertase YidC [Treponema sp.]|jgi:YidC/Oxa1 family membrane protein insertase|nr:membrane protein insertase YidC [Treponema sp.]
MEKRTVLAVVLSILVITGFYFIQGTFFSPQQDPAAVTQTAGQPAAPTVVDSTGTPAAPVPPVETAPAVSTETGPVVEQRTTIRTQYTTVILTNAGGDIVSYKLNEHDDHDDYVDMVLSGDAGAHAFTIAFGGMTAQPVTDLFYVSRISDYIVEFYRDYALPQASGGGAFRLTKRYTFDPNEYMFQLEVSLDGGVSVPSIDFNGAAYTLGFGPQIGPRFEKLDGRYDYRQYYTYTNGKRKNEKTDIPIINRVSWAAIAGKYFTFIAIPDASSYEMVFSTRAEPGLASASRFYMTRAALNSSRTTDTFRFYLGPKTQSSLGIYDTGMNDFHLQEMDLSKAASTSGILTPVEVALKWLLQLFYRIVPNYGLAILFLGLLTKIVLFPLTRKGSESTLKMQALAPKIKEIQDKYKDNPQQMNAKMAEFYKTEGYNPLSGCLPILIQFPIMIAMYNLFNNHFDLRGAMFIPGWIPDLSMPESVYHLPFTIPLLGWTDIRLLPFIYTGSQLLSSKITQTPGQQSGMQMKIMMYGMPLMFFFILYNVPAGLTVYWIMNNLLSLAQQLIINRLMAKKKAELAASIAAKPVIAPKKKKKH